MCRLAVLSLVVFSAQAHDLRASDGPAGPDQYLCTTSTVMSADPLEVGQTGTWSVSAGTAVFADNHSPFTQVSGLSIGENTLNWTVLVNGVPDNDAVIVTVYDAAGLTAFAGPDSVLCLPTDTMHLMATPPLSPAIGSWSSVGIALIDAFADPHSFVEFPAPGTVQMIWTVFNGTCGQVSDTVTITVDDCVIGVEEDHVDAPTPRFDPASRSLVVDADEFLIVLDQQGRAVLRMQVRSAGRVTLDELVPGVYTAQAIKDGHQVAVRFVIDR